jgi:hypothetical protein
MEKEETIVDLMDKKANEAREKRLRLEKAKLIITSMDKVQLVLEGAVDYIQYITSELPKNTFELNKLFLKVCEDVSYLCGSHIEILAKAHSKSLGVTTATFKKTIDKIKDERVTKELDLREQEDKLKVKESLISKGVDPRFQSPALLNEILLELNKTHKLDWYEKLAVFLICVSSLLPNPSDHCSAALKGDSSAGKDNLIKAALRLLPSESSYFLTRATSAALEDEVHNVSIVAFSEINKEREGANSDITESFKQMIEGGMNILKKDSTTNYKTTVNYKSEQKTGLFGTTETATDDELETRFVVIPVRSDSTKNKVVVNDVLDQVATTKITYDKTNNWVADGISQLDNEINVIIPFAPLFKNKIKDTDGKEKYLFDYAKERIKRDSKRLMSLTKAIAWLHQKQRVNFEEDGTKYLLAEPSDFITALRTFAPFFNLTYSGLDHRLEKTLQGVNKLAGQHSKEISLLGFDENFTSWVLRHKLQEEVGVSSVNTIKDHLTKLKDFRYVETHWDKQVDGRVILVRPVNSPVKHLSLPVSLKGVDGSLTGWLTKENVYSRLYNHEIKPIVINIIDRLNLNQVKDKKNIVSGSDKIDRSTIDGSTSANHQCNKKKIQYHFGKQVPVEFVA